MLVSKVMDRTPAFCVPFDTARNAAAIMKQNDIEFVSVIENEPTHRFVGVVTDRDLCLRVVADGRDPEHTQLSEVMTTPGVSCHPDDDVAKAVRIMRRRGVHHLAVLDEQDSLVGVISMAAVLRRAARDNKQAEDGGDARARQAPARSSPKPGGMPR